jgi:Uma2 family endonuclease
MTTRASTSRRFEPGTTGWTVEDLDDLRIQRCWERGAYEIVEGVLTKMPAAYIEGSLPLRRLVRLVERHLENSGTAGEFAFEVDLVVNSIRVPRIDAVFLTPQQLEQQRAAQEARRPGRSQLRYGRLRVPPELIIESVSLGHEDHDRQTKRRWYAEFGVPNYWLLDPYHRTLECLILDRGSDPPGYTVQARGERDEEVRPAMFPGLGVPLRTIWL